MIDGNLRYIPLAGPANKQGRIAADNILGRGTQYKGTFVTSIIKLFDLNIDSFVHLMHHLHLYLVHNKHQQYISC